MGHIETIEANGMELSFSDLPQMKALLNKQFASKIEPAEGAYGSAIKIKDNGIVEKTTKLGEHHYQREYYRDGILYKTRESLQGKSITVDYDDLGTAYLKTEAIHGENKLKTVSRSLMPNTTITKNNFVAVTDNLGRPIYNKITDLQYNHATNPGGSKFRNASYLDADQGGHLIPHQFGGPASLENIVAQNGPKVNQGLMSQVENHIKALKDAGHKVDYEIKTNYVGSNLRPSSFEPRIIVDGVEYSGLPDNLKRIYNDIEPSQVKKTLTDFGEKYGTAHETGIKSGLAAAGITLAVSTVDNVSAYIDGETTVEEMARDIATETVAAGVIEYGSEIISTTVSQTMKKSSSALIQKVAGSSLPAAVVSFAVESYDAVSSFAQGEIDGVELTYELGENAASVAGAIKGASIGAAVGTAAGPVGTVAGGIVGGVVGAVVASEVYATVVEVGAEGAEFVAEKAQDLAKETVELFEEHIPDKLGDIKNAFNDFFTDAKIPFSI